MAVQYLFDSYHKMSNVNTPKKNNMPNFINANEEANDSSLDAEAPTSHQDIFSSSHPCHAWVFEECESICRLYGSIHQTRGTQNYRRQEIRRLVIR